MDVPADWRRAVELPQAGSDDPVHDILCVRCSGRDTRAAKKIFVDLFLEVSVRQPEKCHVVPLDKRTGGDGGETTAPCG